MFCRKCGAQMADESAFCPNCGNPVLREQETGTAGPEYNTSAGTAGPGYGTGAGTVTGVAAKPAARKKTGLVAVLIIAAAVLLLAGAGVGGIFLWKHLSGGQQTAGMDPDRAPIFYLTRTGELKYHTPKLEEPLLLESGYSADAFDRYAAVYGADASDNGKVIAYLRRYTTEYDSETGEELRIGELCLRKAGKQDAEDIAVADHVKQFLLSDDGKALWYSAADGIGFYDTEKQETTKLDSLPGGLIDCWSSQRLLYMRTTVNGENYYQDYYIVDMTGKEPVKRKLDSSISQFGSYSEDLTRFIYTKYDYDPDTQVGTTEVYSADGEGNKKQLLSGDVDLYYSNVDTGEIVYTQRRESDTMVGEFIADDMADVDSGWMEPKTEDYQIVRESLFGGSYTVTDYDAYQRAREEYEKKLFRDELRRLIEEEDGPIYVSDLICQVGEEKSVLAEGISDVSFYDPEERLAVYYRSNLEDVGPVAELSQMTSVDEVYSAMSRIRYGSSSNVYAVKAGGEPTFLFQSGEEGYASSCMGADGLYVMQISYQDGGTQGTLWYAPVNQTVIGPAEEASRQVQSYFGRVCGRPAYCLSREEDLSGEQSDLYLFQNGSGTRLVENTGLDGTLQNMGNLGENCFYFMADYNWDRQSGEFYRYDGKNPPEWLASDVYSVWGRSAAQAYFLRDYAGEQGDLYFYEEGKQPELIDREVVAVFSYNFAEY